MKILHINFSEIDKPKSFEDKRLHKSLINLIRLL